MLICGKGTQVMNEGLKAAVELQGTKCCSATCCQCCQRTICQSLKLVDPLLSAEDKVSEVYSFICSFVRSFVHAFIHSFIQFHSFILPVYYVVVYSLCGY